MNSPTEYRLRPFRPADARLAVEVVNADSHHTLGLTRAVVDGAGAVRMMRYVPADSPRVVAVTPQDEVVAYAYLADRDQGIVYEIGGAVHPAHWDLGVGCRLIAWAEQEAAAASQAAPHDVKTVLQTNLFEGEQRARRLFSQEGFGQVREWLHLERVLDATPPPVEVPEGFALALIDVDNDWDRIGPVMDEAFADHWGTIPAADEPEDEEEETGEADKEEDESPEDESYSNAPGFCFMLLAGEEVVGGILCNARLVERDDTGRVGSVFVRPDYRRRGVGRTLMLAAFNAFWQAGLRRIVLDTDAGSFTQAPLFYTQLGLTLYRREFLYEKALRPGREVRRLHA